MRGLHVLSDFDGVWTEPEREMLAVRTTVLEGLAALTGWPRDRVESAYEALAAEAHGKPEQHGWHIDGELTSFLDEDYFGLPAAVGQVIEERASALARELADAVRAEYAQASDFMDACYHGTCQQFRADVPHDLTRGAEHLVQWLERRGVTVAFATNAPAEKVRQWFGAHGIEVADARTTGRHEAPLRVFGRTGKQWLSDAPETRSFAGRSVRVDRPQFREVLESERPDLVIGDVLSLDLALPIHLRCTAEPAAGDWAGPRRTVLIERADTPAWVRASVGPGEDQVNALVPHVTALPRLLAGLGEVVQV